MRAETDLDLPLGVGIDVGRGLVQNQYPGIRHQRAGETQKLALSQGQIPAALIEHLYRNRRASA